MARPPRGFGALLPQKDKADVVMGSVVRGLARGELPTRQHVRDAATVLQVHERQVLRALQRLDREPALADDVLRVRRPVAPLSQTLADYVAFVASASKSAEEAAASLGVPARDVRHLFPEPDLPPEPAPEPPPAPPPPKPQAPREDEWGALLSLRDKADVIVAVAVQELGWNHAAVVRQLRVSRQRILAARRAVEADPGLTADAARLRLPLRPLEETLTEYARYVVAVMGHAGNTAAVLGVSERWLSERLATDRDTATAVRYAYLTAAAAQLGSASAAARACEVSTNAVLRAIDAAAEDRAIAERASDLVAKGRPVRPLREMGLAFRKNPGRSRCS